MLLCQRTHLPHVYYLRPKDGRATPLPHCLSPGGVKRRDSPVTVTMLEAVEAPNWRSCNYLPKSDEEPGRCLCKIRVATGELGQQCLSAPPRCNSWWPAQWQPLAC
ncbi:hypothetical protein CC2G_012244 [Coprinopsis cinerea AmutBmut pab1-1]|nr:hypothetical protein CC2G_012244 [Coprinopsis cinerea AmutBmut pab1-1]